MYWKYIGNILECIGVYWEYIGICWKYHLKTNFRFKIQNTKCLNIKRHIESFTLSELYPKGTTPNNTGQTGLGLWTTG